METVRHRHRRRYEHRPTRGVNPWTGVGWIVLVIACMVLAGFALMGLGVVAILAHG